MSEHRWVHVRNWERFQHRDAARQRVPTWIKLHVELLSDSRFFELSERRRLMLLMLWLEYASTRRRLPEVTAYLSRRIGQRVLKSDLEALSDAGFITFSASEYDSDSAGDVARLEKRREEPPISPADAGDDQDEIEDDLDPLRCARCGARVQPRAGCKNCGATSKQAGTNPRALQKPSAYERAKAFTLNVGRQYETRDFADELSRFELNDEQQRALLELRASTNGAPSEAISNPFIED